MNKKFFIYMAVVLAITLGIYAYVGGFSSVDITKATSEQTFVVGRYYQGNPESKELGERFTEVGQLVEKKQLTGDFAGIYYNKPTKETKLLKAFIGVAVADSTVAVPQGFELRVVPAGQPVLLGKSEASVMLAPKLIYEALFDYAEEHKLALQEFYVERFPEGKPAQIQVFLK
ncbi:GyrI-like domain-containing protein [Rufibacter sp. LB8]|uniref:GyrI-like domain-containing protein n=1 Tax=Rufibacter sp. LB8 TaxID=2777781 RepID=UPI00178C4CD4|nr:GyrI-like domain-containing protein [Rufibacter sp. LB8]